LFSRGKTSYPHVLGYVSPVRCHGLRIISLPAWCKKKQEPFSHRGPGKKPFTRREDVIEV
jgi:hypothetical protein